MRLPTVVHRLESCRKFTFSPLSCFWDKLVKVVSLFTEFHVYRKFDVDTRLYLTFHLLMNALNSFNSVRSFYSAVTSTVVSKEFSANHSTSLSQAYLSLFVIGPIVLDQRQCLGLSLIWTAWQMSNKKNLNAERTLWMDAGHALQIQGVIYFSLDSKFIFFCLTMKHCFLRPTTLVTRVGNFILYAFCPSPPLCNVDKTHWPNASLHLTIFQQWKGEWGCWHLFNRYHGYEFMFLQFCPRLSEFSYILNAKIYTEI